VLARNVSRDIERPAAVNQGGATDLPHPKSGMTDVTAQVDSSVSVSDMRVAIYSCQSEDERCAMPVPGDLNAPTGSARHEHIF
jgi:hypothetical protein